MAAKANWKNIHGETGQAGEDKAGGIKNDYSKF
jgi:hypothetical protein